MNFSFTDFSSKYDQINCVFVHIKLKKSLMENFIFCFVRDGTR